MHSSELYRLLSLPKVFHRGITNFWDEPYISLQLLNAHLDPDIDGASRKFEFIDDSVEWIQSQAGPGKYPDLLDVGCGPGLYAERLCDKGYRVTGVDFSRRSIDYAVRQAEESGRSITYRYINYLEMEYREAFDLAIMIYCDYGALSPDEASLLLSRILQSLRPGGKLLLDVFTLYKFAQFKEKRIWENNESGGFWRSDAHFTIQANCIYENHVTLEQTIVLSSDEIQPYYIWQRHFSPDMLVAEVEKAGFRNPVLYGDVTGRPWSSVSETMAVIVEK